MRENDHDRKRKRSRSRERPRDRSEDRSRKQHSKRDRSSSPTRSRSRDKDRRSARDHGDRDRRPPDRPERSDRDYGPRDHRERDRTRSRSKERLDKPRVEAKRPLSEEELKAKREQEKEIEQAILDEEMKRRRERVKQWQEARNKPALMEDVAAEEDTKWTLEDDDEEVAEDEAQGLTAEAAETTAPGDVAIVPLVPLATGPVEEEALPVRKQLRPSPMKATVRAPAPAPVPTAVAPAAVAVPAFVPGPPPPPPTRPVEDFDPLDAFMQGLLSSGDVAEQSTTGVSAVPHPPIKRPATPPMPATPDLFEGINYHGSNTITMADIAAMGGGSGRRGWESDSSHPSSPQHTMAMALVEEDESEEAREAREEAERLEFVEAFRKARQAEDRRIAELEAMEAKQQDLGRVFLSDDLDENALEAKRSALELLEDAKRGKMLKEVDHSKIEYLPFRKNLYIVPKVLSKLTDAEVTKKRDLLQIKVRGKGCPVPVDSWEQCGLSDRILQTIYAYNLSSPFPIQKQAIPAIMCGRDVIGVAKTGSGKTLAFLLPMFRHIQDQPALCEGEGPIGLIMAPARELAFQISNEAKKFAKVINMRVACVYGGAQVAEQIAELKRLAHIVVCTPGRLIDIMTMQAGKLLSLRRVSMVVLDEADRMFDMGFEPQITAILKTVRPDRQVVLLSATFPKAIEKLARTVLKLPLEIIIGERSAVNKDIQQIVEVHEEEDKFLRLLQLLGVWYEAGKILVFVDKQDTVDHLYAELLRLGYPCLALHGGKEQIDRDQTIYDFKVGARTLLIATSVAGRGLDVPDIVVVINFSCPNHFEDYIHRVGRTGRAGKTGTAYTFLSSKEEQYAGMMVKALSKAGQEVPQELSAMAKDYEAKVSSGEATKRTGSGYGGSGYSFGEDEMNEAQRTAVMQKKAYEVEQGLVEDEAAAGEEDKDGGAAPSAAPSAAAPSTPAALPDGPLDAQQAVARAKLIAQQMLQQKAMASTIVSSGTHFYDELDINDYPVMARRKVTQRQSLDDITEQTGCAVTSRGTYQSGDQPPKVSVTAGRSKMEILADRRLHLLIEGASEMQVRQAKMEILRQLEEETIRLTNAATMSGVSGGRYSVL